MFDKLRELAARGALAVDTFRKTGVGRSVSLRGLGQFARDPKAIPRGPTAILYFHACNTPDKVALIQGDLRFTYRELDHEVNRMANGLVALGVTTGERVAVMMRNSYAYLLAQWATARAGGVVVQVGYRSKAPEVAYFLEHSRPRAFLYHQDYAAIVEEAQAEAGVPDRGALVRVPDGLEALAASGSPSLPPRPSGTVTGGVIVYTSGTTGRAKGASRSFEKAMHDAVMDLMRQVGIRHDDRHLVVCPLYHSAAPAFVALTYAVGGTVVIADTFEPEAFLELVQRERITSSLLVPTMLGRLTALPEEVRRRYDTSSLRWLLSAAAPLSTATARLVEEQFGPILWNFYGATETGMVTLAGPGEHTARPGTIGRALLGNDIRLFGEDGQEVPTGEVGEMYVKSTMLIAYHGDAGATQKAMRDGYFSVGDMARVDADGYYYLADRKHDMVISGGVNIYPQEIEQHLHGHPAILECAVIGIPDPDWGESLKAFIVLRPGAALTLEELRAYCRVSLADYKCPKQVQFVEALPRNPTGKILKRELRKENP